MPAVGELWAEIGARTDKLDAGLKRATRDFDSFARKMNRIGTTMTVAITAPLVAFGRSSVKAASDAEEMRSKFDAVFKDLRFEVRNWAKVHATEIGRSSQDWEKYLAAVQDTLVPLGFARDEAAEMSKQVVTLAEDLASFNNLRTDDVVQRLTSALVGNVENLRMFGVVANEAQIKERAFRDGLIKTRTAAITPQQKALAILNLAMAGTTDAQGDAIRTSGSFANKVRALESSFKDLKIAVGDRLLPSLTGLVDGMKGFVDNLNKMDPGKLDKLIAFFSALAVAGPALKVFSKVGVGGSALIGFGATFAAAQASKDRNDAVGVISTWFTEGLISAIRKVFNTPATSFGNLALNALALPSHARTRTGGGSTPTAEVERISASTARFLLQQRFGVSEGIVQGLQVGRSAGFGALEIVPPELTEAMERAAESMNRVGEETTMASVRMAEFGQALRVAAGGVLSDFTRSLGDAAANVIVFGDSLKETLSNLGKRFLANAISSVATIGATAALSAIPGVGPALAAAGATGALGAAASGGGESFKRSNAGLSARLSLGDLVVSSQRAATNNGLHLIGLA